MKKATAWFGLILLITVGSSLATETRTMVMGENDMILVDEHNIFGFPGRLSNYPNIAMGELSGTDDFHNFGINWQFGKTNPWVVGTYFSSADWAAPVDYDGQAMVQWDGLGDNSREIDLMVSRRIGRFHLGVRLNLAQSSWEMIDQQSTIQPTWELGAEESYHHQQIGIGLSEASGKWDLAFHLLTGSWTDRDGDGNRQTRPDGFHDLELLARRFLEIDSRITLVPHARFRSGTRGFNDYDHASDRQDNPVTLDLTVKNDLTLFEFGVGMNYESGSNLLAAFDLGMVFSEVETEQRWGIDVPNANINSLERNSSVPYFKIGLEAEVLRWLDLRLGATSYWKSHRLESQSALRYTLTERGMAENTNYLGFGFHFGRLYIDTYTDPEIILDGFYFISGTERTEDLNARVSVLYEMF